MNLGDAGTAPGRLLQVRSLFDAAIEKPEGERRAFLEQAAGPDVSLRDEVLSLLAHEEAAKGFLRGPAAVPDSLAPNEPARSDPNLAGRQIGPYRLLEEIGRGGMGTVYRAARTDDAFQRTVALKLVRGAASSDLIQRRFLRERQILGRLQHPNIATVFDGGTTDDGQPYLVMEYLEGEPIDRYCAAREVPTRQRLEMFRQVCAGVHYAHQNLVVHRDLKPGNILVTPDGTPKLLDFGIAKLLAAGLEPEDAPTATMLPMMTPEYASPEQVRGEAITTASDVYSLGVVLYELLTGRRPYVVRTESMEEIVRAVCGTEPPAPSTALRTSSGGTTTTVVTASELRGDLDTIVLKAVRKEPGRRYLSVQELSEDIRRHLARLPVMARADSAAYRAGKFVMRHRVGMGAAVLLALSLIGGIVMTLRQARIAEAHRQRAERRFADVRKLARTVMFDVHDAVAKLPGSTATRKLLVGEALAYLDRLASEAGGDVSLQRELASGYEKMADVLGRPLTANLGDVHGALVAYGKAQAAREELLSRDPDNAEVLRELSTTSMKMSRAWFYAGDPHRGTEEARKASLIEERLAASDHGPGQRFRVARSGANYGYMLFVSGRTVDSLERLREAIKVLEELKASGQADAEVIGRLAVTYGTLADVLRLGKPVPGVVPDLRAALEMQQKTVGLNESLATAAPADLRLQRQVMVGIMNLGETLEQMGERAAALERYRQGVARTEQLARADATNLQAQKDFAWASLRLGELLARNGDVDEAFVLLRRATRLLEPVIAADPADVNTRSNVAVMNEGFGHAHVALASRSVLARDTRLGHWREAKARFQDAYAFWKEMRDKGVTTGADLARPETLAREIAKCDAALGGAQRAATVGKP